MKPLPSFLKRYFWDVDFSSLDKKKYPDFIIARILEQGDQKAINWLENNFNCPKIRRVLTSARGLSSKSVNYWSLILNVPKNKILCLQKQSQNKLQKTWPY